MTARTTLPLVVVMGALLVPSVAQAAAPAAVSDAAFVDPGDGRWYVPNGQGGFTSFVFGAAGDVPISGDWDCDGDDTPGRFRPDGYFYLRNASSGGDPDIAFFFGMPGDHPLVGDWNGDGCDAVAVYRPGTGRVISADRLDIHPSTTSHTVSGSPVVMDVDGDGAEEVTSFHVDTGLLVAAGVVTDGSPLPPADMHFDGTRVSLASAFSQTHALARMTPVAGQYGHPCGRWCQPAGPTLSTGDVGALVIELRTRLAALGFRPGEGDEFDANLGGAVMAFQKYHDLPRDGVFHAEQWEYLDSALAIPFRADTPNRVEVDLGRQILFLVLDHQLAGVIPVSSANGETYTSHNGKTVTARTPEGDFSFYREEDGWYRSYLGALYEPFFFRGGYAIHGSNSVPAYPASHGCIRTQIWDQDWLKPQLEMGMEVFVYGVRTEAPSV